MIAARLPETLTPHRHHREHELILVVGGRLRTRFRGGVRDLDPGGGSWGAPPGRGGAQAAVHFRLSTD